MQRYGIYTGEYNLSGKEDLEEILEKFSALKESKYFEFAGEIRDFFRFETDECTRLLTVKVYFGEEGQYYVHILDLPNMEFFGDCNCKAKSELITTDNLQDIINKIGGPCLLHINVDILDNDLENIFKKANDSDKCLILEFLDSCKGEKVLNCLFKLTEYNDCLAKVEYPIREYGFFLNAEVDPEDFSIADYAFLILLSSSNDPIFREKPELIDTFLDVIDDSRLVDDFIYGYDSFALCWEEVGYACDDFIKIAVEVLGENEKYCDEDDDDEYEEDNDDCEEDKLNSDNDSDEKNCRLISKIRRINLRFNPHASEGW
ncbi:MAG: hypothetical protein PHR06_12035 [Candidatus Cloacimonetes bacterium]|nr:hypothetical protein [Candidatus Cloacimonadota bacterium]